MREFQARYCVGPRVGRHFLYWQIFSSLAGKYPGQPIPVLTG